MKQRKKSFGMKISAFVLSFAMVCTLLAGVNVVAFAADDLDDSVNVMRFNNTMTGEHIFTANDGEINYYNGMQPVWQNEDVAWKAPLYSESGVYRIFNNLTFEHMWTTDAFEVFINTTYGPWTLEQDPAFYSDDNMGVPVYRLSKKGYEGYGAHHYTVDETERFWLLASGEWNDEGVAFYGVKEEEPTEFEITATQTGSDEVTILSDVALSEDDEFTLMRGTTVVGVTADVDEGGMSATLYTDETIIAADYTVVVTKADESTATDTFTGEVSKLTSIGFVGDKLILTDTTYKSGMVAIRGFNQFGEPQILDNNLTLYASDGTATYADKENGIVAVMKAQSDSSVYVIGSPIVVTAVYQKGTTVLQTNATLTISQQQAIKSFEFGEIATALPTLKGQPITHNGLTIGSYYIPVTAVDQYDNVLTAGQLNGMAKGGSLLITPNAANSVQAYVNVSADKAQQNDEFITLPDGTVAVKVTNGSLQIPGTAVISMVSVGGTSGTTSFQVEDNRYIAALTVDVPTLYSGKTSDLTITAVDQYGNEFSDADLYKLYTEGNGQATTSKLTFGDKNNLVGQGSEITTSEPNDQTGKFSVIKNAAKKTLKIKYTPGTHAKDTQAIFTIKSASPNVSVQYVDIKGTAAPLGIMGLRSGVPTVLRDDANTLGNNAMSFGGNNVVFTDTYGNVWMGTQPTYTDNVETGLAANSYYYTVTANPIYQNFNAATGVVTPKSNSGAMIGVDTYKITLYSTDDKGKASAIATKNVQLSNSDGDFIAYKSGMASALNQEKSNLYTGNDGTKLGEPVDMAKLVVYGIDAAGNAIPMTGGYTASLRDDYVADSILDFSDNGQYATSYELTVNDPNDDDETVEEGTAYVDVYVQNNLVDTVSVTCSNAPSTPFMIAGVITVSGQPVVIDLEDGLEVPNGMTWDVTPVGNDVAVLGVGLYSIYGLDQYGMAYLTGWTFGGTEIQNGDTVVDGTAVVSCGNISAVIPITTYTVQ